MAHVFAKKQPSERLIMAKLIYAAISSLDGYVADSDGNFDWSMPDEEVHRFVNGLERDIGIYLYGRRMYEVMRYWETAPTGNGEPSAEQEFAKTWQAADKIIYSRTLDRVATARTRPRTTIWRGTERVAGVAEASGESSLRSPRP